jgi:glycerol-3-phosphate dehydrogenase
MTDHPENEIFNAIGNCYDHSMSCFTSFFVCGKYYSTKESIELIPTLATEGNGRSLRGTVVYYDGQMNDARLNVGLACTAALAGAAVMNHAEVVSLLKDGVGERIIGARIRDNLTGNTFYFYLLLPLTSIVYYIFHFFGYSIIYLIQYTFG